MKKASGVSTTGYAQCLAAPLPAAAAGARAPGPLLGHRLLTSSANPRNLIPCRPLRPLAGKHSHRRARYVAGLTLAEVLLWSEDVGNEERRRFVTWLLRDNFPRWLQARGGCPCQLPSAQDLSLGPLPRC